MSAATFTELAEMFSQGVEELRNGPQRLETYENALFNRYDSILASQEPTLFISQTAGDDTNNGSEAAPLKTLAAAVALVPKGGIGLLRLVGNYTFQEDVSFSGKTIILFSDDPANKPVITFQQYVEADGGSGVRRVHGLVGHDGHIIFRGVRIVMPAASGGTAGAVANSTSGIIKRPSSHLIRIGVTLFDCEMDFAESNYVDLIGDGTGGLIDLHASSVTVVGSSMAGKWLQNVAANTAPSAIPGLRVRTNLATL